MRILFRCVLMVCTLGAAVSSVRAALVHQWNLDDDSGTVITPQVGTIQPTIHGWVSWETFGPPTTFLPDGTQVTTGNHLHFLGDAADYADFGSSASLSPANLTVAFWVKADPGNDYLDTVLFSKHGNVEDASSWEFGFSNNAVTRQALFKVWTEDGYFSVGDPTRFTIEDFADDQWHHFVGTYDGSQVSLVIDGREISTAPATGAVCTTSDPLYLGQRPYIGHANQGAWAVEADFGGPILIFDNGLSGEEAAALGGFQYEPIDPYTPPEPALVGRWDLSAIDAGAIPVVVGAQDGAVHGNVAIGAGGPPETTLPGGAKIACENHLEFGGTTGDYVDLGADEALCPGELTVAVWVQATELHTNQVFVSKHGQGGSSYELGIHGGGMLEFRLWTDDGTAVRAGTGTATPYMNTDLNDGSWHLVVGTHSLEETSLYIDGQLIEAIADAGIVAQTITEVNVGRRPYSGAECPFSGNIGGPLLIFNYALTAEEIAQMIDGPVGPTLDGDLNGDGMVSSFDLDAVRSNWGRTDLPPGSMSQGDANGDGMVTSADLDLIRANWGCTIAAVPEPRIELIALITAMVAFGIRRLKWD